MSHKTKDSSALPLKGGMTHITDASSVGTSCQRVLEWGHHWAYSQA